MKVEKYACNICNETLKDDDKFHGVALDTISIVLRENENSETHLCYECIDKIKAMGIR